MKYSLSCILLVVCSLLPFSSVFAQSLTVADLLKIYNLDSTSARQYCTDKQLPLTVADNTGSNRRHQYATPDSNYRLEIRYPNDSASLNVQMNYWFTGTSEYKKIEEDLRKAGFHKLWTKQAGSTLPANASRYLSKNLQAELIRPQGIQKSYWLFLHPPGNYNW